MFQVPREVALELVRMARERNRTPHPLFTNYSQVLAWYEDCWGKVTLTELWITENANILRVETPGCSDGSAVWTIQESSLVATACHIGEVDCSSTWTIGTSWQNTGSCVGKETEIKGRSKLHNYKHWLGHPHLQAHSSSQYFSTY